MNQGVKQIIFRVALDLKCKLDHSVIVIQGLEKIFNVFFLKDSESIINVPTIGFHRK